MPNPYRPSSIADAAAFQFKWCAKCCRDNGEVHISFQSCCGILLAANLFAIDDPHYPAEWIEDEGGPRCTAWNVPLPTEADRRYLEWKASP